MMKLLVAFLIPVIAFFSMELNALPIFRSRIPNGANVTDPCNKTGAIWGAIGHLAPKQGNATLLNAFGKAFQAAGLQWTAALCREDSDGDGRSNGDELGDPNCVWQPGMPAPVTTFVITHPGICEPVSCKNCQANNAKFSFTATNCPALTEASSS